MTKPKNIVKLKDVENSIEPTEEHKQEVDYILIHKSIIGPVHKSISLVVGSLDETVEEIAKKHTHMYINSYGEELRSSDPKYSYDFHIDMFLRKRYDETWFSRSVRVQVPSTETIYTLVENYARR